ncbi:MAG: 50S ribosomal protein L20 [Alphaproteobacteria bacterium]|nr:MAG: 50S ribosomal protein L20 [Rickettsiaceae bacterium 4572_127]
MAHVKRGTTTHARHKKVIKMAKGFRGRAKSCFRIAVERVERAMQYAYRDRRNKKRDFRRLWITRINAGARIHGMTYSQMMGGLKKANIQLDRKTLSELAIHNPEQFAKVAEKAKRFIK